MPMMPNRRSILSWCLTAAVACAGAARAADKPDQPRPPHGLDMDYGPFLSYSVLKPGAPAKPNAAPKGTIPQPLPWKPDELMAHRGTTVKLSNDAAICFDADMMRYAGGWTGGWLNLAKTHLANEKGSLPPAAIGVLAFTTAADVPGFASASGSFADPRQGHEGPLPRDWAHFKGIYRDGRTVVFAYTVGSADVLDQPGLVGSEKRVAFTRTVRIGKSAAPIRLMVCDAEGGTAKAGGIAASLSVSRGGAATCVGLAHAPPGAELVADGKAVVLTIPPLAEPAQFTLVIAAWPAADAGQFAALLQSIKPADDLTRHTRGGPGLYNQTIETSGFTGSEKDAYTVDTVKLPETNPWNSWMRLTALDFFSDGRCAVTTWSGDLWIVSGLDDRKLDHVKWRRFATGLYDPLGLRIVNDQLYVLARDAIYRLHDLDGDGEADFYENVNNDRPVGANYNAFAMDLQTDSAGNFYYTVAGNAAFPQTPMQACVVKVSNDGSRSEALATGLRTANGMGAGPNDLITLSDNQGNWVPTTPIFVVRPGGFYGFEGDPHKFTKAQLEAALRQHPKSDPPLCWIPYTWDNSGGGQVWAGDRFGPLSHHMLHLSYGKATLFEVLPEQVDPASRREPSGSAAGHPPLWQASLLQLPLRFDSGIQRARVSPTDGQIWLCGLHGWQTAGSRDGCLQRVRYTGKPFYLPTALHVTAKGLQITFDVQLDPEAAKDLDGYGAEQWTYHWSEAYGSSEYKTSAPDQKGHDTLEVTRATLSPDRKTVTLDIPGLAPVMQYEIKIAINAADGKSIKCDLAGTINRLPAR